MLSLPPPPPKKSPPEHFQPQKENNKENKKTKLVFILAWEHYLLLAFEKLTISEPIRFADLRQATVISVNVTNATCSVIQFPIMHVLLITRVSFGFICDIMQTLHLTPVTSCQILECDVDRHKQHISWALVFQLHHVMSGETTLRLRR